MTLTVLGRCPRTHKLGYAVVSDLPAIGGRVATIAPTVGVVALQGQCDVDRLNLGMRLLEQGHLPGKALADLSVGDAHLQARQFAFLDGYGRTAAWTGSQTRAWAGDLVAEDFVALGEGLTAADGLRAASEVFAEHEDKDLEERLLLALAAGLAAAPPAKPPVSAALAVHAQYAFPIVNLRIDMQDRPVEALASLFGWFRPLIPFYIQRILKPTSIGELRPYLEESGFTPQEIRQIL